jgi:large subunit ribosomal protein L47
MYDVWLIPVAKCLSSSLQCRKTMARIKAVLNERRLAYEGAMKLAEKEHDAAKLKSPWDSEDKKIVEYLQKHHLERAKHAQREDQVVRDKIPA